jgi:pimeloyl-ACP methyl ester carboxylesterase
VLSEKSTDSAASPVKTPRKKGLFGRRELSPALDADCDQLDLEQSGRVCYYSDTRGTGRPLVLLHSVNAAPSAREMAPIFEHYRAERPVYAPDLPGFGRSDRSDRPYSPALYAATISEFMRQVVQRPADVVAFSLSSEFAARAAADVPALFRTLALISPSGFGKRQPPQGATGDRILRFLRLPGVGGGLFRALTSRASIRYFLGQSFHGQVPRELIDYAYETAHQPGARYAPFRFLSMKLFTAEAYTKLYEPLRLPVLVLYDKDPNISFERLDHARFQPNWQVRRIEPTRGLPHWEKPEETFAALDAFWGAY